MGTPFTFTAGSSTITVPAGSGPGGTCVDVPNVPAGTNVTVTETIPAGDTVSSITAVPPGQLTSTNLATGTANVTIGIPDHRGDVCTDRPPPPSTGDHGLPQGHESRGDVQS